jgi:cardiolipin synthase A/B
VKHSTGQAVTLGAALTASAHAIIYKREPRSALLWVLLIWLAPVIGPLLYLLFGVNRIRRRAARLFRKLDHYQSAPHLPEVMPEEFRRALPSFADHLAELAACVNRTAARSLTFGNRVEVLMDGDEAYPAMVRAIEKAEQSISLCTYIFDRDKAGMMFSQALADAVARGVEVRVLVDDAGARYSWPTILPVLRRAGVPCATFLPTLAVWRYRATHLRNHRKILVVDGRVGFTGGMNIREGLLLRQQPRRPVRDLHFRLAGPAVAQLQETFADDWLFVTRESLRGERWFPQLEAAGPVLARGISDGPDENFGQLRWTLLSALACARHSVRIVTPYFLPDAALVFALNVCALRGLEVDIILPERNNLPFVQWAMHAHLWQVLEHGCRVWLNLGPFDHSKLLVVDGAWALLGSANWDARSLRLNFEFDIECYSAELGRELETVIETKRAAAHRVTLEEVDGRPLPIRLRDGVARLFVPYL